MRKIFLLLLALFTLPALSFAAAVTGCDFDGDNIEDTVTSKGCRNNTLEVFFCNELEVKLSSDKSKRKQLINFKDNISRKKKAYSNFVCEDRDEDGDTELYANNKLGVQERIKEVRSKVSAGLNAVCKSTRELQGCEVWKASASTHIPGFDPRANSTSFITTRGCPGSFPSCIQAFDGNGSSIHSLGQYFPTGSAYDNRHYGGHGCGDGQRPSSIASEARKKTGSSEIFVKDSAGVCVRIPDPSRCFNSSGC